MIKHHDNHAIEACIRKYPDIRHPQEVVPFQPGAFHNALYEIRTARGHFVLKLLQTHDRESTEARYEYLASVMERASSLLVKAPLPIRNECGHLLTPCGEVRGVLSEYIPGKPFERENSCHQEAAGRLLGLFHKAMADFVPRGTCWIGELGTFFPSWDLPLERIPTPHERDAIREHYSELMERCLRTREELLALRYPELPRAVIHSEYVVKHLRMEDRQVTGLLDFEYTYRDARVVDVALALEDFPCSGRGVRDFSFDRIQTFLHSYNASGVALQPEEISSIPTLLKAWCLGSMGYWIRRVISTGETITLFDVGERLMDDLRYIDWWDAHGQQFVARCLESYQN